MHDGPAMVPQLCITRNSVSMRNLLVIPCARENSQTLAWKAPEGPPCMKILYAIRNFFLPDFRGVQLEKKSLDSLWWKAKVVSISAHVLADVSGSALRPCTLWVSGHHQVQIVIMPKMRGLLGPLMLALVALTISGVSTAPCWMVLGPYDLCGPVWASPVLATDCWPVSIVEEAFLPVMEASAAEFPGDADNPENV